MISYKTCTSCYVAGIVKMLHKFVCYRPEATFSPFLTNPKSHGTDCSPGLIPKVMVLLYTCQCLPGTRYTNDNAALVSSSITMEVSKDCELSFLNTGT